MNESNKKTVKAYAKINLHLDVMGIAENGYHLVSTVMQTLSLCDDVDVSLTDADRHTVSCTDPSIPTDEKNLVWRAADIFFDRAAISKHADIKITKRIPAAAGLAGGSADAAAVFIALNELCGYPLTTEELLLAGASLGADVPFCIMGGTKFADRFGDVLHDFPSMPSCYIVVSAGKEGVSTPWAYSLLDTEFDGFRAGVYEPRRINVLRAAAEEGDLSGICGNTYNIFEGVIEKERADVSTLRGKLTECGALCSMMSGSGPSVFGIFDDLKKAEAARDTLSGDGFAAFVCEPISR